MTTFAPGLLIETRQSNGVKGGAFHSGGPHYFCNFYLYFVRKISTPKMLNLHRARNALKIKALAFPGKRTTIDTSSIIFVTSRKCYTFLAGNLVAIRTAGLSSMLRALSISSWEGWTLFGIFIFIIEIAFIECCLVSNHWLIGFCLWEGLQ